MSDRPSAIQERATLLGHRQHDEFWYADRFSLDWPRLASTAGIHLPRSFLAQSDPSPSPAPCNVTGVTPETATICVGVVQLFTADGTGLDTVKWTTGGAGTPATGTGPTFSTKFSKAGNYKVSATCGDSSASAAVTAVSIAFSKNPVKTGVTVPLPNNPCNIKNITIATTVVATVTPASAVGDVAIVIGGTKRARITNKQVNAQQGTITVTLSGTSMTPANKPNGDTFLQAKVGTKTCQQVPVIVIAPFALKPVSSGPTVVKGVNVAATACTSPAYVGQLAAGQVHLWTTYNLTQSITVLDQFGNRLDAMYNGAPVFENLEGALRPINVTVNGGVYSDPVGEFVDRPGGADFAADSPEATAWPTDNPSPAKLVNETQNIAVQIAGVTLSVGIVNRQLSVVPVAGTTTATVTITWQ